MPACPARLAPTQLAGPCLTRQLAEHGDAERAESLACHLEPVSAVQADRRIVDVHGELAAVNAVNDANWTLRRGERKAQPLASRPLGLATVMAKSDNSPVRSLVREDARNRSLGGYRIGVAMHDLPSASFRSEDHRGSQGRPDDAVPTGQHPFGVLELDNEG